MCVICLSLVYLYVIVYLCILISISVRVDCVSNQLRDKPCDSSNDGKLSPKKTLIKVNGLKKRSKQCEQKVITNTF